MIDKNWSDENACDLKNGGEIMKWFDSFRETIWLKQSWYNENWAMLSFSFIVHPLQNCHLSFKDSMQEHRLWEWVHGGVCEIVRELTSRCTICEIIIMRDFYKHWHWFESVV